MKVYVLSDGMYSDRGVCGVYSTLSAAMESAGDDVVWDQPDWRIPDAGGLWYGSAPPAPAGNSRFSRTYDIELFELNA